jgi:hypothetical protein
MAIAKDPSASAPYSRVVRTDEAMIDYFPDGAAAQARRLKAAAGTAMALQKGRSRN